MPIGPGSNHLTINGVKFSDNAVATSAYIIKQTGSNAYLVQDAGMTHVPEIVFMVNATTTSGLQPGECFIMATPFGGSSVPCSKIAQYRVDVYENNTINSYSWSTMPAAALGEADLITIGAAGEIVSVSITNAGRGYLSTPTVSFTGGGSGATATATITNGIVSAISIGAAGSGYANGNMTISAPAAAVTSTATATITTGAITALTVVLGGNYYTVAPLVTITGDGTGATATATIAGGVVTGFTITTPGTVYTTATVTIAAPPASVQATATAIVS